MDSRAEQPDERQNKILLQKCIETTNLLQLKIALKVFPASPLPIITKSEPIRKTNLRFSSADEHPFQGIKQYCKSWQVNHFGHCGQVFRLVVKSQLDAAAIHDRLVILKDGFRAKTNFDYTKQQLLQVLEDLLIDRTANINPNKFQVTLTRVVASPDRSGSY